MVLISISAKGQITYDGPERGFVPGGITLNTDDYSFSIRSLSEDRRVDNPEPELIYQHIDFEQSADIERTFYDLQSNRHGMSDSLILLQSFQGIPQTNYNPPDDYIAVGPGHIVLVVNNLWRIFDKSGNILNTINAAEWYSNLVGNANPVDPKILYDHFNNRWLMVWISVDHSQLRSYYFISVSDDDDPNGIWYNWALRSDVNGNNPSNNWGDYPGVGFDDKAVYITSNQFSFSGVFNYVKVRIIKKEDIYISSNPQDLNWTDFWNISIPSSANSASYLRPTRMFDTSDDFYLFYLPNAGGNFCAVYTVKDVLTNPLLNATVYPLTPYSISPDAKQRGSDVLIQGGFCALRNEPFFKDSVLHSVHCIRNPNNTSLSSLHYLAVNPLQNIVLNDIAIGSDEHYFFYPALVVDKNNNVLISYSRSSSSEYAGGFYNFIPQQTGIPSDMYELKEGSGYFNRDNGSGRSRWGDYSGAWLDPVDSLTMWISVEYVEAINTWGTWVVSLKYDGGTIVEIKSEDIETKSFELLQNYPNPFNPSTKIKFTISTSPYPSLYQGEGTRERSLVTLKVYDVVGNEIATLVNEELPAGEYEVEYNGSESSSGVYFYTLRVLDKFLSGKMILRK